MSCLTATTSGCLPTARRTGPEHAGRKAPAGKEPRYLAAAVLAVDPELDEVDEVVDEVAGVEELDEDDESEDEDVVEVDGAGSFFGFESPRLLPPRESVR